MNELQKHELQEIEEMQTEQFEGFQIDDLSKLTWAMRKMSALQAKIKEVQDVADAQVSKYQEWAKKETDKYRNDVDFFTHKITEYHQRVLAENPKDKSIVTAEGTIKSTTRKATVEQIDKDALLSYAKSVTPEHVKVETVEKVDWAKLKSKLHIIENDSGLVVIDEDGNFVEGVAVKPQTTTFKIEVGE